MISCNILDCTLRDGGYINNFCFGKNVIQDTVKKLSDANTDIIECGFLKSNSSNLDQSLYGSVEMIEKYISPKSSNSIYVAMIAYGDISIDEISECSGESIDGIRLTFHPSDIEQAFSFGKELQKKKYKVFMQPVGTTSYTEDELLSLVDKVNLLNPFAFYMVDTLGTMFNTDLLNMFHLIDNSLSENIRLGFHSHNNLQLSFSNAITLLNENTNRNIIIDASVFGMGRGAGNLCTELIMEYINTNIGNKYDIIPVLEIYDEYINKIRLEYKWGYSLPYFIAASNQCHPNYATHLINKQTMSIKQISVVLSSMDYDKKSLYDEKYIESLYIAYQKHVVDDSLVLQRIKNEIGNRDIVILAPGKSVSKNKELIQQHCIKNNSVVFSVNHIPKDIQINYLFVSNYKRIKKMNELNNVSRVIVTSNLLYNCPDNAMIINYSDYLNDDSVISDNAGLMLMNFLRVVGVKKISLAGFDGFSLNSTENYYDFDYMNSTEYENLIDKTQAIAKKIKSLSNHIRIEFLTESQYE